MLGARAGLPGFGDPDCVGSLPQHEIVNQAFRAGAKIGESDSIPEDLTWILTGTGIDITKVY